MPLTVRELKVKTKGYYLVKDVYFKVERGQRVAIVGESGSGKSISALSVLKLLPESLKVEGEISVDGVNPLELEGEKLRKFRWEKVSVIFQDPNSSLNPLLTIGEQVGEAIRYHREVSRKEEEELVKELLKRCQVPQPELRAKSYPHQLSGGLKQRCAVAMALACGPDYLIADEPTTALDVTVQKAILELLARLSEEEGLGIVLITHDMGIVEEFSQESFVIYAGYTVESGKTEELFKSPKHPYTKGLLECSPKITGRGKRKLRAIPGSVPEPSERIKGCPFHPRCPRAREVCRREVPPLVTEGDGKFRCFYPL